MSIAPVTDHVARAIARLVSQFRGQPRIEAIVTAFVNRVQAIEDLLQELLTERSLDAAVGDQLDGLGDIVGQEREGRGDEAYRLAILARVALNVGSGTPEDIYRVLTLVLASLDDQDVELEELFPAALVATTYGGIDADTAEIIAELLSQARPAGVGAQLVYSEEDESGSFLFADADAETVSTTQGAVESDEDDADGGVLAEVLEA